MTRKLAPILAGIALAGGLAFGGASLASAQDGTSSTTEPATESTVAVDRVAGPVPPATAPSGPPAGTATAPTRRRRLEQLRSSSSSSASSAES